MIFGWLWPQPSGRWDLPDAGLFGHPVFATTGIMAMGKQNYLNLQQCGY